MALVVLGGAGALISRITNDVSIFNDAAVVGIDDGGAAVLAALGDVVAVGAVDVAVDEVPGPVFVQQLPEALEPPVREVSKSLMPRAGAWVSRMSKPPCFFSCHHSRRIRRCICCSVYMHPPSRYRKDPPRPRMRTPSTTTTWSSAHRHPSGGLSRYSSSWLPRT